MYDEIDQALSDSHWLIALDRDGTLVPYANRPEEAVVDGKLRGLISDLCAGSGIDVAIISARSTAQLRGDFDSVGAILAGNYGLEVLFPDGQELIQPHALNAVPMLKTVRDELSEKIDLANGAILEDHGYTLCLHFQNVHPSRRHEIHAPVLETALQFPDLSFKRLPTSYEVTPSIPWDKGFGLSFIDSNLAGDCSTRKRFFAGDTTADTPGFIWTNSHGGISIQIGLGDSIGATHRLDTPEELHLLLEYIVKRRPPKSDRATA